MKIITILGARPQFIKGAAVSRAIAQHNERGGTPSIEEVIVHTGQHYDSNMSDIFFEEMGIPAPGHLLNISGGGHGAMTGRMLEKIEAVLFEEKPDAVIIYGDTNSTLAGALAATKIGIPVAHVEAGLRSFNRAMPEELNRIMADRVSDLLLCPTETAMANLTNEGIDENGPQTVVLVGDVMLDAALHYAESAPAHVEPLADMMAEEYILCTFHRAENTDDPARLSSIIQALDTISQEIPVILPLHPRTRKCLGSANLALPDGVTAIDPVGYFEMLALLRTCSLVMTDSGGLQKEAYFFEKHCVTLRDESEWVELEKARANIIAGADRDAIYSGYTTSLNKPFTAPKGLYGNGKAGEIVVKTILESFTTTTG